MVQPKYNPEEALKRVKLMMGYDTSKTLTENVNSQKKLLNEASLADGVKKILDGCITKKNQLGTPYMDQVDADRLASEFVTAFASAFGTDNDKWRAALKEMKANGGYADLCRIAKSYEDQAQENFYEGIDSDIDYDSEWSEFVAAFTMMVNRTLSTGLKTKEAESQTINSWESKFPCVFKTNSNADTQVRKDTNNYTYILVKGGSGKQYALFFDGRLKTPDMKLMNKRLTCNGDRPSVVSESVKKKLSEQIDDSGWGAGSSGIDDGGSRPSPAPAPAPRPASSYTACSGTYKKGCKSDVITKVQGCLNADTTLNLNPKLSPDGKFGPKTQDALTKKGFTTFTDADVDKICTKPLPDDEFTGGSKGEEDSDDVLKRY